MDIYCLNTSRKQPLEPRTINMPRGKGQTVGVLLFRNGGRLVGKGDEGAKETEELAEKKAEEEKGNEYKNAQELK